MSAATRRRRNHALWIGPLLVVGGGISYFLVFAMVPDLRDFPWVNLPLVLAGVALSALGLRRAVAERRSLRARIAGGAGLLVSVLVGGLFCAYIFVISYWLPPPTETSLGLRYIPTVELRDDVGGTVNLADYRGRKLLIVFYRGHW